MGLPRLDSRFFSSALFSLAWLGGLAIHNCSSLDPILSIFPYLLPVVFFAWFYSAPWGFLFSALATLSAIPAEYVSTHTQVELVYAGITTYAQLTGAAIGTTLARIIVEKA